MHYARRRTRRTADRTYQQQAMWRRRSRPGRRSRPARACRAPPAPLPLEPASLPLRPAQPPQQRPSRRRGRLQHTDREARPSGPSRLACAWHARPAPLPLEPASAPSLSEPARHPEQRRSRRSGRLHPTDREARPLGQLARLARAWRAWQAPAEPPAVPLRPAHAPERRRPRRSGRPDPAGRHERPPEAQKRDFRLPRCQIPEYRPFGCQIPDFRPLEFEFELPLARASSRRHGAPQAEVATPRLLGSCPRNSGPPPDEAARPEAARASRAERSKRAPSGNAHGRRVMRPQIRLRCAGVGHGACRHQERSSRHRRALSQAHRPEIRRADFTSKPPTNQRAPNQSGGCKPLPWPQVTIRPGPVAQRTWRSGGSG